MFTKADIQRLRALREKKVREAQGLFIVEGEKVMTELLAAGVMFEEIHATESWHGARTHQVTEMEMARISHFPAPTSVLGVGRIHRLPLPAGGLNHGLTLALDGVQDPGNVGMLLRIADWYGLDRIVLSTDSADLFSQKVINASKGSFARMRVHTANLAVALGRAKVPVLGCDLQGENVRGLEPLRDAVIVIGSEGRGLSAAVRATVTRYVTIPRLGGAESLNAAVAAGIVCDNLRRNGIEF